MYTKNAQIRISLLNYSRSSINLSSDVLDGLFRQCPLYFNMLTAISCTIVLLLWKNIHFLKCCIYSESHQILITRVLIFGSPSDRFLAWQNFMQCVYCESRSLTCQVISNSVIQIHSFCLVRYYAGLALRTG